MSVLKSLLTDLREKRLWPVAVLLLVAIVAVPVLLSKSTAAAPVPAPRPAAPAPTSHLATPVLPVVQAETVTPQVHLTGSSRDPFASQGASVQTAVAVASSHLASAVTSTAPKVSGGAAPLSGSSTSSSSTSSSPAPLPIATPTRPTQMIVPPVAPKPAPPGLSASQAYDVALGITNSSGGVDTVDPLERLSVIPSEKLPLLVELGVHAGGHRVLFAVQPGAVLNGPGACTPGPIDCEILSLAPGQTEGISVQTSSGDVKPVALFAVTSLSAADYPSPAAAAAVRRMESPAGRAVLGASHLTGLSLFQYQPALGAVVDLRNLTVGG